LGDGKGIWLIKIPNCPPEILSGTGRTKEPMGKPANPGSSGKWAIKTEAVEICGGWLITCHVNLN